jgi:subtilase family serine protease
MRFVSKLFAVAAVAVCATAVSSSLYAADKAVLAERTDASATVAFDVFLPLQHRDQLEAMIAAQTDSSSASYHQWLTPEQFNAQFGPSANAIAAVRAQLESFGLTTALAGARQIHVSGPAGAVERALSTELHNGTFANGKKTVAAATEIAPKGALASSGAVVLGLEGFVRSTRHSVKLAAAVPENRYSTTGPYWFTDLKQAYKYPSYQVLTGKGVTIGVLMEGDFKATDMTHFFNHEGLAPPKMNTVNINGGAPYDPDISTETHLDMQQTGGMAPDASIVLYNLPSLSDLNIVTGLSTILVTNKADVVSMSFGGPELAYTRGYNQGTDFTPLLGLYDELFAQGNAQGITFVASSGDLGALSVPSLSCFVNNGNSCGGFRPSVETPASSPHVTGVGGTNLVTTYNGSLNSGYVSEQAFGDPLAQDIFYGTAAGNGIWASGGGDSLYYPKPVFQTLVDTGSKKWRTVPDVSGHMGGCPAGSVQPCQASTSSVVVAIAGGLYAVVGTSASAPDFAGLLALKVQKTGSRQGNENGYIYALGALEEAGYAVPFYHDDVPGYNGLFSAGKGYNRVLGNGTVIGVNYLLAPAMPVAGTPGSPSNP